MSTERFPRLTRRGFLRFGSCAIGGLALPGALGFFGGRPISISGGILGGNAGAGHLLRGAPLPPASDFEEIETLIVGGGIAGLSAAWWLGRNKYDRYILLEVEKEVGGNSQSGRNSISGYPWGAHYVPLPGPSAGFVRMLFEDLAVIEGYDPSGNPRYNEFYLCADPHERLFFQGQWRSGLIPNYGLRKGDLEQFDAFFALMEQYKKLKGRDGRPAFVIPLDSSSGDPELTALDRVSFKEFLDMKGWNSKYLHWYANYCCRDDYGAALDKVSAWAGIHYFASRTGVGANADAQTVLTWPEGNGWIVNQLKSRHLSHIRGNSLVYSIEERDGRIHTHVMDVENKIRRGYISRHLVFAGPRFAAAKVIRELVEHPPDYMASMNYTPWMVANVSLNSLPKGEGSPLSWDNVSFYSDSLGYIVATHQELNSFPAATVITYYLPLSGPDPRAARDQASKKTRAQWVEMVVADLKQMHPGIEDQIENIDVWIWGHGMICPSPGFIWGGKREKLQASIGNIHFAHSDMSGISIFEEAQYRGVQAARKILAKTQAGS